MEYFISLEKELNDIVDKFCGEYNTDNVFYETKIINRDLPVIVDKKIFRVENFEGVEITIRGNNWNFFPRNREFDPKDYGRSAEVLECDIKAYLSGFRGIKPYKKDRDLKVNSV